MGHLPFINYLFIYAQFIEHAIRKQGKYSPESFLPYVKLRLQNVNKEWRIDKEVWMHFNLHRYLV